MYVGFCNDTIVYKRSVDEFIEKAVSLTEIEPTEMEDVSFPFIE